MGIGIVGSEEIQELGEQRVQELLDQELRYIENATVVHADIGVSENDHFTVELRVLGERISYEVDDFGGDGVLDHGIDIISTPKSFHLEPLSPPTTESKIRDEAVRISLQKAVQRFKKVELPKHLAEIRAKLANGKLHHIETELQSPEVADGSIKVEKYATPALDDGSHWGLALVDVSTARETPNNGGGYDYNAFTGMVHGLLWSRWGEKEFYPGFSLRLGVMSLRESSEARLPELASSLRPLDLFTNPATTPHIEIKNEEKSGWMFRMPPED